MTDLVEALLEKVLHGEVEMILNTVQGVAGVRVDLEVGTVWFYYYCILAHIAYFHQHINIYSRYMEIIVLGW